jgi:hypothetical protein
VLQESDVEIYQFKTCVNEEGATPTGRRLAGDEETLTGQRAAGDLRFTTPTGRRLARDEETLTCQRAAGDLRFMKNTVVANDSIPVWVGKKIVSRWTREDLLKLFAMQNTAPDVAGGTEPAALGKEVNPMSNVDQRLFERTV